MKKKTWKRKNNNKKAWQTRRERYGKTGSKNPAQLIDHLRKIGKKSGNLTDPSQLKRMGKNSRGYENKVSSEKYPVALT